mmetsp:Transcript_93814/g.289345  ORF Transcript_93814/g.289345 Transcript_93814/m.289345 type:complete len:207 (-) Transcript_93814:1269-1889(-)
MFERFWISLGTRAFTSSNDADGRALELDGSSSSPPLRKTQGLENSEVSMLSKSSVNCWSCRWHALSYMSKMRCLIISFCLMSLACFGYSGEYRFAFGVPSSLSMNSTTASFCFSKNHLMRSPTYCTRRCSGKCASLLSSFTTTSRHVRELMETPLACMTSRFLVSTAISENRRKISTSFISRRNCAPPLTSTSKVAIWISFRRYSM